MSHYAKYNDVSAVCEINLILFYFILFPINYTPTRALSGSSRNFAVSSFPPGLW